MNFTGFSSHKSMTLFFFSFGFTFSVDESRGAVLDDTVKYKRVSTVPVAKGPPAERNGQSERKEREKNDDEKETSQREKKQRRDDLRVLTRQERRESETLCMYTCSLRGGRMHAWKLWPLSSVRPPRQPGQ
ncbi:hypothetical protein H112_02699 [Trichophyton rubrum D6]|uniref:Uncharacterized protein n=3 Tax=Trichophyton TaxID=5550 RepID=A0A080WKY3_TRIRC|nr:uncharacterized protein TERG_12410 [Trichophyton rubrum CBS 118892]EZF24816.1 hypothetical protein H100_02705 [Trichophyton rubrum MR850]EZF43869.1 hypothetical protein H102_02697 [Trichophyton rubrum CBS 100081]EZF54515.1 hypothetical protein H103_02709 [Trichophyton rubrum CBS 288.86]EZF65082.1 hypothetical protein H104_02688 [Trichophyton rubrum CBS 289.86]EZF75749.1 hypothetical protein H105_02715 [Trichophyton soudanense CBS 452.61]EZF86443.1 hypothetical protein H110_02707 [Trichophy